MSSSKQCGEQVMLVCERETINCHRRGAGKDQTIWNDQRNLDGKQDSTNLLITEQRKLRDQNYVEKI